MRNLTFFAAACTAFLLAAPATGAVLVCGNGPGIDLTKTQCTAPGNDKVEAVEAAIAAATGVSVDSLSLVLLGKSDEKKSPFTFSIADDGKSANWSLANGTRISYVTVKASNTFKVYQLGGTGAASGTISTAGILNGGGQQPKISHVSLWTASAVPEPGTWAMMILGLGAVGLSLRRRKKGPALGGAQGMRLMRY